MFRTLTLVLAMSLCALGAKAEELPIHWSHPDPNSVDSYVFALGTTPGADDVGVFPLVAPSSEADGTFRAQIETPPLPPVDVFRVMVALGGSRTSEPSNILVYPIPEPPVLLENCFGLLTLFGIRRKRAVLSTLRAGRENKDE